MLRVVRITFMIVVLVLLSATVVSAQFLQFQQLGAIASHVLYSGSSNTSDVLDLFVPNPGTPPYPVVVKFNFWQPNSSPLTLDPTDNDTIFVVEQGYAVVSVRYTPSVPQNYSDAFCALAWVYANAQQYHLDTSRIALFGSSWGGLIAAFIAETADPTPYLSGCPNQIPADHTLRGVITNSGAFLTIPNEISAFAAQGLLPDVAALAPDDLKKALASMGKTPPDQWCCLFFPLKVHDALYELPIFHVTKGEPPFLMVQGAHMIVPYQDTLNFAQAMLEQGDSVLQFEPPPDSVVGLPNYQNTMAAFLKQIFA